MDCSPLAMAFKDPEMKLIPLPPPGTEYERLPSPPPSGHSSQDDEDGEDDKMLENGDKKKKIRRTPEDYLRIRNENVVEYLRKLKEHPPPSSEADLAKFREYRSKFRKGKAVLKPEVVKKKVDEEFGCSSDTSHETTESLPRDIERVKQHDLQVQCYEGIVEHRKQHKNDKGAIINGVLFSHANFQGILEAKWRIIKMNRLEQILEGVELGCRVDPKWTDFGNEIQKCYGPMDTESLHFRMLVEEFQTQRWEMIIEMFEEERKMMERMLKQKKNKFPQQLAALRETRSTLEIAISAMSELQCDQNPYTNPDGMDFWVMPRPKQTIEVYGIHNEEMEKFVECNVPLDGNGVPQQVVSMDQNSLFVRKGYNAAVFDVGWHYSPVKAFWDTPRWCYLGFHSGNCSHGLEKETWTSRLLELRRNLMDFNPFGVEDGAFSRRVSSFKWRLVDAVIFESVNDTSEGDPLINLYFTQTLVSNGGDADNKIILFDSHLEGVIVTPAEMLQRLWTRIKFLIEQQPNHLIPLNDIPTIYEEAFGQKFFPLQWGFEDAEEFFQNIRKYLPKEMAEEVIIVPRDESEVDESGPDEAAIKKKIDAKWAEVLGNDEDEEDDDDGIKFDCDDLFDELVWEGPWVEEGEVYRVLDD